MRPVIAVALAALVSLGTTTGCGGQEPPMSSTSAPAPVASAAQTPIERMAARFAPTEITADLSGLTADERAVVAKLVQASKIVDALFLRQVWVGNPGMLVDLARDRSPEAPARLH